MSCFQQTKSSPCCPGVGDGPDTDVKLGTTYGATVMTPGPGVGTRPGPGVGIPWGKGLGFL